MRPSISKCGCPCPKPDPNRLSQNQTHLLVHALHRKTPKCFQHQQVDPGSVPHEGVGTVPEPRGRRSGAEAVMESHPKLPPATTPPPSCWQMGTGRLGVIYTPPAAQLSSRKEPRGRKVLLPAPGVSITPGWGDVGVQAASALEAALSQWGFPQKTG